MQIKRIKKISKNVKTICYVTNFKQPDHFIVSRVQMWVFYSYNFWHHSLCSGSFFFDVVSGFQFICWLEPHFDGETKLWGIRAGVSRPADYRVLDNSQRNFNFRKTLNLSGNQLFSCPLEPGSNSKTRNSESVFFFKKLQICYFSKTNMFFFHFVM